MYRWTGPTKKRFMAETINWPRPFESRKVGVSPPSSTEMLKSVEAVILSESEFWLGE
jgi:hypothetical protein